MLPALSGNTEWSSAELTVSARASMGTGAWEVPVWNPPPRMSMGMLLNLAQLEQKPVLPARRAQAACAATQPQAPLLSPHIAALSLLGRNCSPILLFKP